MNRDDRGASAVELALFLPLIALLVALGVTTVHFVSARVHLDAVGGSAVRYATRAAADPGRAEGWRTRPTSAEVASHVAGLSRLPVESVVVTPEPVSAHPGTEVTVEITAIHDPGVLADAANSIASLIGQEPPFPGGTIRLTSTATSRQE